MMERHPHPAPQSTGNETPDVLDTRRVRQDFPILKQHIYNKPLIYLDNAATSHKPQIVIETLNDYYSLNNSNVHRGVHTLSMRATRAYENSRERVVDFIGAAEPEEVIFVRGTTERPDCLR